MNAFDPTVPPYSTGTERPRGRALAARARAPRPCGVLVVDDDTGVRAVLDAGLRREGLAVWLAADGLEGLGLYWRHCDAIDVVLLDVGLPDLDGPQTLTALRQADPHVRCCFMSGHLGRYNEAGLRALGAVMVLHKPFRPADVAETVRVVAGCPR